MQGMQAKSMKEIYGQGQITDYNVCNTIHQNMEIKISAKLGTCLAGFVGSLAKGNSNKLSPYIYLCMYNNI